MLISAGVRATPLQAMLHALVSNGDEREVWWIQGARGRASHVLHDEARELLDVLSAGRALAAYSRAEDREPGSVKA